MVKITIDGIEYEVEPVIAKEIQRLQTQERALQNNLDEKGKAVKDITKEKDTMEARADALKAELDEEKKKSAQKMDANEIKTAAKARIELLDVAEKVCDEETVAKLDDMDDIEIKKAIVKSKHDINLDEKSEDYINAFVDAVKSDMKDKDDTEGLGKEIIKGRQDGTNENDITKARQKSMKEDSEAWNKPLRAVS